MTQTGYANAIVNAMLGWLKGLAGWVLRLFNLSGGFSPLRFLADNWLELLMLLLIIGVSADLVIWLIRWRPHWVWFHKKRVIINDKNFFAGENEYDDEDDWEQSAEPARGERANRPRRNWHDNDYVVASAARRQREERKRQEDLRRKARAAHVKSMQMAEPDVEEEPTDVFRDGLFNVNAKQKFSDRYEDEVFSVSDLPQLDEGGAEQPKPRAKKTREGASRGGKKASGRGAEKPAVARKRPRVSVNKR